MKKFLKSSLSMVLALTIILSSALVGLGELNFGSTFAVKAEAASVDDLVFELNDDGESYFVNDCYENVSGELVIPDTYNGLPVTRIGDAAFYNCRGLTSVTIPDSVTSIGEGAFEWTLYYNTPSNWVDGVLYIGNHLIEAKDTINGDYLVKNGTKTIAERAFYYCKNLNSITIPDSVTSIGEYAFQGCTSLTSFKIGKSVTSIGKGAIDGTGYYKDTANWENDVLYLGNYLIDANTTISGDYIIKNGAKAIADNAFSGCDNLSSVTIPDSITSIGDWAFYNCYGLTYVTISDSVTSIGERVFYGCGSLTSIDVDANNIYYSSVKGVLFNKDKTSLIKYPASESDTKFTIPDSVTNICNWAFDWCTTLTSVTIPVSVTKIGNYAFYKCFGLTSIKIPDSVTSIGQATFNGCTSLTSVSIPDSVTSIGDWAFYECTRLTSIVIPNSVTRIGNYAFYKCFGLTSIKIPDSVTSIGDWTFYSCKNLTTVTIPDSVTNIGNEAFDFCGKIKHVYYQGSKEQWKDIAIGSYNGYLTRANIHYNSGKTSVNAEIVSSKGITFSLYNKQAWAESDAFDAEKNAQITNATVEYNGKQTSLSSNSFFVSKEKLSYDINITAPNFQKYIVPEAVTKSWAENSVESFSAYMIKDRKDGKTYISTVFARNCSESGKKTKGYIDVTTDSLNLLNGVNTDVIITTVEQNSPVKEYWLSQDELHKISDSDGVFSAVDLYSKFDENKPVYAYAVLENGLTTVPVSVSLKKVVMSSSAVTFLNTLNSGKVNFLGENGFKVTLSDSIPIVGGASVSAGMASLPVGVEIENERVRISIGVDIFKNEINGKDDTTYLWENFKDSCKSINKSVEDATDKMKTYRNLMIARQFGTVKQDPSKKKNFDCSFLGYIEAYIIDGEIVFKEVSGTVALEFFFNYKQQFLVAGIPAIYAYVKAGAEASASATGGRAMPDNNFPIELDVEVNLTPSVKIGGGVGVKDAISAGVWGKGSMPVGYNFTDTHLTLGLKGEFGLEAEFFVLKGDVTLLDGSLNLIDHYFRKSSSSKPLKAIKEEVNACYSVNNADVLRDGKISLADRSYLENTSEWLGGQSVSRYGLRRTITPESVTVNNLQTSVYKNSQTQLVQFGDTMLMAWIEDCADRDSYNRMRLVYSVYNTETGAWNEPRAVADNGKCDAAPSLATDGENVYIAWQNIDYTVSTADSETVDILMKNAEIRLAKYNVSTGNFENIKTVTDNSTYDYAPKVTVNNGVAEVYWVNSSSLDFAKSTISIQKSDFNGVTSTVLSGLNYIHSLDSNGTDISYAMDKDGDTSTTADVKVYTNYKQVSVDYENAEFSCMAMVYGLLDGKKTLFYADDYNIYYIQNGEEKAVFDDARSINGNLQICSNGLETTVMWLEAGEMGTELYTCSYENGKWTAPIQLTSFSKVLSNVSVTYFDGKIYGLFNRTHLEEVTSEVDGSTYYKNGETDLCQLTTEGFTDISLSLIEIDESQFAPGENSTFTVLVNNNGTEKVTDISFEITDGNGYSQTIEKAVDLASGESKFVELTYAAPETISQTELSVYASVNNDVNEEDNTISENIGSADLSMGDLKVKYVEGKYIVSGIVTNKNNVAARKVWVNAYLGEVTDDNLFTHYIDVIEPKSSYAVEFVLDSSLLDFEENSSYDVTINVSCDESERITSNNQSVTCITKTALHIHSYEEVVDREPTCTEDGSKHKECTVCGEVLETEVIAKTGHKSSDWITDKEATVSAAGSKHKECTVCKEVLETATILQLTCSTPNLTKIENASNGIKITWGKVTGAQSYNVYRKTYSNGKWSGWSGIKYGVTGTSYTDTTAKSGTTYTYTVRAKNAAGLSSYNTTGLKIKFLSTPKLTSISNGSGKVTVKWNKVTGASGYYVYRQTYSNGKWSGWKKVATTSNNYYNDTKISSGNYYKYTVRAYNGNYISYYNTTGLKTKYLAVAPLKSAVSQSAGVKVTWGKVTGAKGYNIYRQTYSNGKWSGWSKIKTVSSGSTVTYTDKSAKKGVTYKYTVRAISDSYLGYYNTKGLQVKAKY